MWAVPENHPISCLNPAPWRITEATFEYNPPRIMIRGENRQGEGSCWFPANKCFINTEEECEEYVSMMVYQERKKLAFGSCTAFDCAKSLVYNNCFNPYIF